MFLKPVIIIGAPRSGTSLLQKIVREHPAFVSVPRESDVIWFRYCHPANLNWDREGIEDSKITPNVVEAIRTSFQNSSLHATTWQRWSGLGLMRNPVTSKIIRKIYGPVFKSFSAIRNIIPSKGLQSEAVRLVDKSVHCPLWLNLVEAVFPDALFLHIVRDARKTIDSMIDGWDDPSRFNTFDIPEPLNIDGYTGSHWNFALPEGWRNLQKKPLEDVVAFQWVKIQESIIAHTANPGRLHRYMRIRLEDLVENPGHTLHSVADFIELSEGFDKYAQEVPVINAGNRRNGTLHFPEKIERILPLIQGFQEKFGYSPAP